MARKSSAPPPPGWNGICLAKSKATGEQCKQRAILPTTKCHYHGGRNLRGPAHPNYKHGKDSSLVQALPKHLQEVWGKTMNRDDLVHLRGEISLLEAREVDLLQQLRGGGSVEFWKKIRKLRAAYETAKAGRDAVIRHGGDGTQVAEEQGEMDEIAAEILDMIDTGAHDADVWREILEAVEMRRRLSDTERRRLEMLQAYLTPDQAIAFASHLVTIVRDVVDDRKQLSAIISRVQALLPSGNRMEEEIVDAEPMPEEVHR